LKKLLLHICCAPCAVYVFEKLKEEYDVTGYFYNPNIHPEKEYMFRLEETKIVSKKLGWKMVYGDYDLKRWFELTKGHGDDPERGERCSICFNMRFEKAFEYAKSNNFDYVTSTLSISPYKVTDQINREGFLFEKMYGVKFLPENFKKKNGYNIGRKMGAELGIKHQNYCGCVYSRRDRMRKINKR